MIQAQLESILDAASKMAQGGIVFILTVLLLISIWGLKTLFDAFKENSHSTIGAIVSQTEALKAMTRSMEENERASEANRASIESLREIINTWIRGTRSG